MKGKRRFLCQALHATGLLTLARLAGSASRENRLLVLAYHRIREGGGARATRPDRRSEFDDDVFSMDFHEFRAQMKWLQRNMALLSEADLIRILESGKKPPPRSAMITFDDGYRDNYTLAFPLLRDLGIPALFFIPTLPIEKRELGWWDLIAYAAKRSEASLARAEHSASDNPATVIRRNLKQYASLPPDEASGFLDRIFAASGIEPPLAQIQSRELMSWDEVIECHRSGIAIGSHTHTHRVMARLPLDEQRHELTESKRILESKLQAPVRSIAYPVGGYEHFSRETPELARECGFSLGFSFRTGRNAATLNPFDIRRASPPSDLAEMIASVELPRLLTQVAREPRAG